MISIPMKALAQHDFVLENNCTNTPRSQMTPIVITYNSTGDTPNRQLPIELYREIIEGLSEDRKSLRSLLLVNHALGSEAERVLYRRICDNYLATQELVLRTLNKSTRHAKLVRQYSFWAHEEIPPGVLKLLACCLRAFVNLKHLTFRNHSTISAAKILSRCTFQLTSLNWGGRGEEAALGRFLGCHHLTQLHVK